LWTTCETASSIHSEAGEDQDTARLHLQEELASDSRGRGHGRGDQAGIHPHEGSLEQIGSIKEIQDNGKNLQEAKRGDKIAISLKSDITLGRQVVEGEPLYVSIPDNDIFLLKEKYKDKLGEDELAIIEKITAIKWKRSSF
jgi:hypothetical protein